MTQTQKTEKNGTKVTKPVVDVSSITASDVAKKLEALAKAKKEGALHAIAPTGLKWEPEKEGETLDGVYMGESSDGRNRTHLFSTSINGKIASRVIPGSHSLNRQLGSVEPGTAVSVRYIGTEPREDGREQRLFEVLGA